MGKSVREAMTMYPRCAEPSVSVIDAAQTMVSEDVGSLPVVDGNRLIGMITDRDIVARVVAAGKDARATSVGEVASTGVVTADPRQDLDEAVTLMARHQVRRLPVVEEGALVGILSQADVALEAKEKKIGEMVEEISQPIAAATES
jgi:CBS domain-containing protein